MSMVLFVITQTLPKHPSYPALLVQTVPLGTMVMDHSQIIPTKASQPQSISLSLFHVQYNTDGHYTDV